MRPFVLLALLFSVTIAFNVFREEAVAPEDQLLSRSTRAAAADSSDSSDSDEKEGSGSGDAPEEQLRRVARDVVEEASGEEGSGVTSVPIRFIRSVDVEGSGSGSDE
uniref:Secreted protein n=1 Tax=Caenorhabditis tropicalis TaxID=1561998 RepID=A0A1I7V1W8_9PELO